MTPKEKIKEVISLSLPEKLKNGFDVRFWDGEIWKPAGVEKTGFTLVLNSPGALKNIILPPTELNVTEAYFFDEFDLEGDLFNVFESANEIAGTKRTSGKIFNF
ncbi:hypothetical protein MASR2M39_28170 [Ignavibacteriales bacterium]